MVLVFVIVLLVVVEICCFSVIVFLLKIFLKDLVNLKLFGFFYVELFCGNFGWKEMLWCLILMIGCLFRFWFVFGNVCKIMVKLRGICWNRCCWMMVLYLIFVLSILILFGEVIVCCVLGWIIVYDGIIIVLDMVVFF